MKRLAIVTTHPIQYYDPVFKLLSERGKVSIKVFYSWGKSSLHKFDPGFGAKISWDIPLLNGYEYTFLKNVSKEPGSHHYNGIDNPEAYEEIALFSPDAVLIYGWSYKSHLALLRKLKNRIPVIFRGDSTLMDHLPWWKHHSRKLFLRWVYSHVDTALYVGTANKRYFMEFGLQESQLVFAPHAVDNNRYSGGIKEKALEIRESLKIKASDTVILFSGKLEPKKDPCVLLTATKALERPDLHLIFVGTGILEAELKAKSDGMSNVHFLGFQNQSRMPEIYQAADLFCLPSTGPGETWGLAVNEAMAAGKAIITSDKVGCSIDLVSEENGRIFQSSNSKDLADKISDIISNKDDLRKAGERSAAIISEWTFLRQVENIEGLL